MSTTASHGQSVHANGIDIHYLDHGEGEPLVLLHGGVVSTNPIWTGVPVAYASHMDTLGGHFRVIAPDTRGCGKTVHSGGTISFDLLADDVAALIDALDLERPLIAGFSDGGITATVLAIRHPGAVRAIVNHAGFDAFDPDAPTVAMMRQILGGSPDATAPDPDAAAARVRGDHPEVYGQRVHVTGIGDRHAGPDRVGGDDAAVQQHERFALTVVEVVNVDAVRVNGLAQRCRGAHRVLRARGSVDAGRLATERRDVIGHSPDLWRWRRLRGVRRRGFAHQPMPQCEHTGLRAVGRVDLAVDVLDVAARRLRRDHELLGDLLVR